MFLEASWKAPAHIRAVTTLREGGVSEGPLASLNLGLHVGDDPARVAANRQRVAQTLGWTHSPLWLNQVHGTHVVEASTQQDGTSPPEADGAVTSLVHRPLAVMTADCLPVVFCDRAGTRVGIAHAGWRGLLNGVLESAVQKADRRPSEMMAWIGPGIGPDSYQVGSEIREAFVQSNEEHRGDFQAGGHGKWLFDLASAAVHRLKRMGVTDVAVSPYDTFAEPGRFFSHRRESLKNPGSTCGRQATFIWIA